MEDDVTRHERCSEGYKECMADRGAVIEEAIATRQPGESIASVARRANVTRGAVSQRLGNKAIALSLPSETTTFTPPIPWEAQPEIVALKKALYRMNPYQRAYAWKHVFPEYDPGTDIRRSVE